MAQITKEDDKAIHWIDAGGNAQVTAKTGDTDALFANMPRAATPTDPLIKIPGLPSTPGTMTAKPLPGVVPNYLGINPAPGGAAIDQTVATGGGNWSAIAPPPVISGTASANQSGIPAAPRGMPAPIGRQPMTLSSSKTTTSSINPKALKKLEQSNQAVADALIEGGKLEAEQAKNKQLILQQDSQMRANDIVAKQERDRKEREYVEVEQRKLNSEWEKHANERVDPDRLFSDKGTGNRFLAILGISLGALGSALTGKENEALKLVTAAIDRDIEAQKANIEIGEKKLQGRQNMLDGFVKATGSLAAAESATRAMQYDYMKQKYEEVANSNAPDVIKNNAAKNAALFKAASDEELAKSQQIVTDRATEQVQTKLGEPPSDALMQQFLNMDSAYNSLGDLNEQVQRTDFAGLGPVEGRLGFLADWAGISDPDARLNRAAVAEALANKVKAASGQQVSDAEAARVATTLMKATDNPKTFTAVLEQEMHKIKQKSDAFRESVSSTGRVVPKSTMRQDFGFKPQ